MENRDCSLVQWGEMAQKGRKITLETQHRKVNALMTPRKQCSHSAPQEAFLGSEKNIVGRQTVEVDAKANANPQLPQRKAWSGIFNRPSMAGSPQSIHNAQGHSPAGREANSSTLHEFLLLPECLVLTTSNLRS